MPIDFMQEPGNNNFSENPKKNTHTEAPQSKKMRWVMLGAAGILTFLLVGILLGISFLGKQPIEIIETDVMLSAIDDAGLSTQKALTEPSYKNRDLDVIFEDKTTRERVLDFQLKSHPSIDYIKKVGLGNQVVMWYDINSQYGFSEALGTPKFTDERTGKLVERDWHYVYWGEEEYEIPVYSCSAKRNVNGTSYDDCTQTGTETKTREKWLPYDSRDIPKGNTRIGIEVEVRPNDYIDGVWSVGGKKISRHAGWKASLEAGLISYWKFDEQAAASGTIYDELGVNNGTNNGADNTTGKIKTTYNYIRANTDNINIPKDIFAGKGAITIRAWFTTSDPTQYGTIFKDGSQIYFRFYATNSKFMFTVDTVDSGQQSADIDASEFDAGVWYHAVGVYNGSNLIIYINGTQTGSIVSATGNVDTSTSTAQFGSSATYGYWDGKIDDTAFWGRALSPEEIAYDYQMGLEGYSYGDYTGLLGVKLISPEDDTNLTSNDVDFSLNVSNQGEVGIQNVTINVYYDNGTLAFTETNESGAEGIYNFSSTFSDGDYDWNATAYDDSNESYSSATRSFTIDLIEPTLILLEPENATESNRETWNFTAGLTAGNYTLNNATLNVWYENGTLFDTQTNDSIAGTDDTNVTYQIASVPFGFTYDWNVQLNYENPALSTFNSTQAENNFTFTRLPFEILNESYSTNVYETERQTFYINISTINNILSTSISLNYDGENYFTETNCVEGFCKLSEDIDIPLVNNGTSENKSFFWKLTLFGESGEVYNFNTTSNQQNVSRIFMEFTNATYANSTVNFTAWNELNRTSLSPMSFAATFDFWLGGGSVKRTNSFSDNSASSIQIAISPANRTFQTDAFIEYDAVGTHNGTYTKRNYHFQNASMTNETQDIRLFLLAKELSTSFIQRVTDTSQIAKVGVLIFQQRYYPDDDSFETVSISKTDSSGESVGFYQTEIPDYRHIITSDGTLLKTTERGKIFPQTSPYTLIFTIGEEFTIPWETFQGIPNIVSFLNFSKTTEIVTYQWIDTTGALTIANLTVYKVYSNQSNIIFCSKYSQLTAGMLSCNISGQEGTFIARGYIGRSPSVLDKLITFTISTIKDILAKPFLLMWIILLIAVVGMGLFFPPAGIVLTIVVLGLGAMLGIVAVGWVFVWAIIAIGIWVLVETSR